jgi:hypothetical protein
MAAVQASKPPAQNPSWDVGCRRGCDFWTWAFVALGLGLRLYHYLRDPSIWHDEAALVLNVLGKGFRELLGPLQFAEASPPLFLWLERAVVLALGDSTYVLRLLSVLASSLALLLMVPLARSVLQPRAVPWAVLLFACSDRLLWHACEAKPYSLDVLMAIVLPALVCWTRGWNLTPRLMLFILIAPVTIFLVYPGCFLGGGVLIALLIDIVQTRRPWRVYLAYGVLVVVTLGAFAVLVAGPVHIQRCETLERCWEHTFPNWSRPWTVPGWTVWSTIRIADYCCRPIGGSMIFLAIIGSVSLWRRRPSLLVLLATPPLLALVASFLHGYPYTGARVMVFAAPALFLLIGEGTPPALRWLRRQRIDVGRWAGSPRLATVPTLLLYALLCVPVARTAFRVAIPWERPDAAAASAYVLAHREADDAVMAGSWEYQYYLRNLGAALLTPQRGGPARPRVWVVLTGKVTSAQRLDVALDLARGEHQTLQLREFADTTVLLAARQPSAAAAENQIAAYLDGVAGDASFRDARRAINAATYPPLKPLSMLTTTTLAEQLLSMVNRGATPEKAAPYPMLVGTATTGQSTSPPTTLGRAPSMPATTTITSAPAKVD